MKMKTDENPKDILYRLMINIAHCLSLSFDQEFQIALKFDGKIKDLEYSLCKLTDIGLYRFVDGRWIEADYTLVRLLQGMYFIIKRYDYKVSEEGIRKET